jgi:DNA-binding transcriptional MerR regulator
MLIGELSKQTGLSKDTIRFYEKLGLIAASNHEMKGARPELTERGEA